MSNVNNNTSNPLSLRQIMGIVENEMDKLGLLSVHEGQLAGELGNTQVTLTKESAANSINVLNGTQSQAKVASVLSCITMAMSGAAGAGSVVGIKMAAQTTQGVAAIGPTIALGARSIGSPLANAAGAATESAMASKVNDSKADQAHYTAVNNLFRATSGDASDSVGTIIQERAEVEGDLHSAVVNEGRASLYDGR